MAANTFFFDQTVVVRRKKRRRKKPEELPRNLRFASLNPRVAAYLANHDRQRAKKLVEAGEAADGDAGPADAADDKKTASFTNLHAENLLRLLRAGNENVTFQGDVTQRQLYREAKVGAPTVLVKLSKLLGMFEEEHLDLQGELVNDLQSGYEELISDARYDHHEWQCPENYPEEVDDEKHDEEKLTGDDSLLVSEALVDHDAFLEKRKKKERKLSMVDRPSLPSSRSKSITPSVSGLSGRGKSASSAVERQRSTTRAHSDRRSSSAYRSRGSEVSATPGPGDGHGVGHQPSFVQVISFSMASKACEERGWILQEDAGNIEVHRTMIETLLQKLRESIQKAKEEEDIQKAKGYIHPPTNHYYGDAKRDAMDKYLQNGKKQVSTRLTGIPTGRLIFPKVVHNTANDSKQKFMTTFPDGTRSICYPSGRLAVAVTNASQGRPGHYTIAYNDDEKKSLLAILTPSGRGSCYHPNGKISLCLTDKGCLSLDKSGNLASKVSWPLPHGKLDEAISVPLNGSLTLRVLNINQMTLTVTCEKETARLQVGQHMQAEEPKTQEELGYIATDMEFTSNAARESIRPPPSKRKTRGLKKTQSRFKMISETEPEPNPLAELLKRLEISDPGSYGIPAERELHRLARKARHSLEEWLEHYRLALGITSPLLQRMPSAAPRRRHPTKFAKSTAGSLPHRRGPASLAGVDGSQGRPTSVLSRAQGCRSAPPRAVDDQGEGEDEDEGYGSIHPTGKVRIDLREGRGRRNTRAASRTTRLTKSAVSSHSRRAPSSSRMEETEAGGDKNRNNTSVLKGCPVALRDEALGDSITSCKCSRHKIPQLTDVELDSFLGEVPKNQLVVLCVVSSLFKSAMPCVDMLLRLHERQNKNRTRPCYQSHRDPYRMLFYDVVTAMEGTGKAYPELYLRHNAVPGMFLIYGASKLLFCDHIFNGYGNARKDFQKQLEKCKHDVVGRKFLPQDFRFSPVRGRRGPRSAWGGQIGGTSSGFPDLANDGGRVAVRSASASSITSSRSVSFTMEPWLTVRPHTTATKTISADSVLEAAMMRLPQTAMPRIIT